MILAPTPRERERWYAILLLAQGLTAAATAEALERDPHTIGRWGVGLRRGRACGPDIRADRWFPPALDQTQQEELKGAVEQPPATAGIVMANWYWKVVRQFVSERFGISLSRSSCLNWLHRLGFAFKRPKKRLLKADESKRETFVAEYAVLWEEAQRTGARIFFADEAHFRADAELRGKWVLKGKPALVDSNSPRYGEKASYYSAVCLETGEVEWMELEGNSNSGTSVAFLTQLKEKHPGPLRVIWDNAPAHRGEAVREYLRTPELELRLVNLPGYSPDFNADEAADRRQLVLPVATTIFAGRYGVIIRYGGTVDYRPTNQAIEAETYGRQDTGNGSGQGWDERAFSAQVAERPIAVAGETGASVAHSAGSLRRGVGG